MNSIRNFAVIIAMFVAATAHADINVEEYVGLIEACRAVTMNDTELNTCTDQMVQETLAQIGVQ